MKDVNSDLCPKYVACIDPKTGIPLAEKTNRLFNSVEDKSTTVFSALAVGVVRTGDYVSNSTGLFSRNFLEVVIRGSLGHSVFIRIQPNLNPTEEFILIGMNNNSAIAQTTHLLREIGKLIKNELEE
ncbi:MAG: hypothetical protein ACXAC7_15295 [Candidatus Hodarchaeales archaeon]